MRIESRHWEIKYSKQSFMDKISFGEPDCWLRHIKDSVSKRDSK